MRLVKLNHPNGSNLPINLDKVQRVQMDLINPNRKWMQLELKPFGLFEKQATENRGSAFPLHTYHLKLDALLS
jgi:hypothetical protein